MDFLNEIILDFREFINIYKMKYKYDNRGVLKRYKITYGLNNKLDEDIWCSFFVEKSAYNYCGKLLILKYWEDNGRISSKLNNKGLEKWCKLVTNIQDYFSILYKIAEIDMMESKETKDIFRKSDYDVFEIDDELAGFIINRLKKYNFKGYDIKILYDIFNRLYIEVKKSGENLQYFYKPTKVIDYILSLKDNQAKLG